MSHQPLALKYRPTTFADVIGQEHVTRTLRNALDQERIGQAYLFSGPRGSGKTSTARILAKALNCERGISGEPCGECDNCEAIAAGRSLDVIEIDAASNRGIDDIKDLREAVRYAPAQGRYKVYIVDEVHQLSKDAFNAFLKTLEEPPPGVVFVLATTEPHRILPTILSRCQRFDFRAIALHDIRDRLQRIAELESIELDGDASFAIAKKADGSLRDGISILEQVVAFSGDVVDLSTLRRLIGVPDEERYLELTEHIVAGGSDRAMAFVSELRSDGYDLEAFYTGLLDHLRNALLFAVGDGPALAEVPERLHDAYVEIAARIGAEDLLRMLTLVADEEQIFRRSSQQALILEVLLVRLSLLDRSVDLERLLRSIESGGTAAGSMPAPVRRGEPRTDEPEPGAAAKVDRPGKEESFDLDSLRASWDRVIEEVHARRPTVAALLQGVSPTQCSAERVVLSTPADAEFRLEQLGRGGMLDPLIDVLARRWGFSGDVAVATQEADRSEPTGESGSRARPTSRELAERDVESRLKGDPKLKEAVDLFDASVVRVQPSPRD